MRNYITNKIKTYKKFIIKLHILTFILCLLTTSLTSQTTYSIVDGSSAYYYHGITTYYYYGYNQYIYKQSTINQAGNITKIQLESSYNFYAINPVKIYMAHTSKNSFSSTSDWVTSGLTLVYNGSIDLASGWNEITLSTPFDYNNSDNLLILIDSDDGSDGAGGSSSWERCCLGLPTLLYVLAENQRKIAENLEQLGAVKIVDNLKVNLQNILNNLHFWQIMSESAQSVCDGIGVKRLKI